MILDKLFQLMAEKQASDIFISAGAPIHIKIQGTTVPVNQQIMDSGMIEKIALELMTPDQTKSFDATMEMNLSFGVPGIGNFRVNIFRQRGSISIVVRYILGNIPTLDSLGLPPVVRKLCDHHQGMILVTGSTGTGKSTTLAAMIDHLNSTRKLNIISLEDPIEFVHRSKQSQVIQREYGTHVPSFAEGVRAAMREDPDVILVGEMRDAETISMAMTAATVFG